MVLHPQKAKPENRKKVRIMVFGTFDMIHPGHRHLFKQARALAVDPYLIVSLARDNNVLRIKGKSPKLLEKIRRQKISQLPEVDKAVLGALGNHIPHIVKSNPDIIALGYDQKAYVAGLRAALGEAGIKPKVIRLKAHKPQIYKTALLSKKLNKHPKKLS